MHGIPSLFYKVTLSLKLNLDDIWVMVSEVGDIVISMYPQIYDHVPLHSYVPNIFTYECRHHTHPKILREGEMY